MNDEMTAMLLRLKENLKTQDNRITSLPMFVVQSKRRIYGMDTQWADDADVVWTNGDGGECDKEEAAALEKKYQETGEDFFDPCQRTAFIDVWEMATVCFTQAGAEAYIAANGHNLHEPRIYVESGYRNAEWELVRNHLMNL